MSDVYEADMAFFRRQQLRAEVEAVEADDVPSHLQRCEDFPCCGHTPEDPCGRQAYDEPGYYDTSIPGQEHRLCDHENDECQVEQDDDEWEDDARRGRLGDHVADDPDLDDDLEDLADDDPEVGWSIV